MNTQSQVNEWVKGITGKCDNGETPTINYSQMTKKMKKTLDEIVYKCGYIKEYMESIVRWEEVKNENNMS